MSEGALSSSRHSLHFIHSLAGPEQSHYSLSVVFGWRAQKLRLICAGEASKCLEGEYSRDSRPLFHHLSSKHHFHNRGELSTKKSLVSEDLEVEHLRKDKNDLTEAKNFRLMGPGKRSVQLKLETIQWIKIRIIHSGSKRNSIQSICGYFSRSASRNGVIRYEIDVDEKPLKIIYHSDLMTSSH